MENEINDSPTQFGYELIRDHVLPSILGKHENDILYWAGKELARKFPMFKAEELNVFFNEAGWGNLVLGKSGKDELYYSLHIDRDSHKEGRSYQLETGFIAEQHQLLSGFLTECHGEFNKGNSTMLFHVKWDPKTIIKNEKR